MKAESNLPDNCGSDFPALTHTPELGQDAAWQKKHAELTARVWAVNSKREMEQWLKEDIAHSLKGPRRQQLLAFLRDTVDEEIQENPRNKKWRRLKHAIVSAQTQQCHQPDPVSRPDSVDREDLRHPPFVCNFPVERIPLFERYEYHPAKIRTALNAVIEAAMSRLRRADHAQCPLRFIVWTNQYQVWMNKQNIPAEVVNTLITSRLPLDPVSRVFAGEFARLPEFIRPEMGGDPIASCSMPIYLFRNDSFAALTKDSTYKDLLKECSRMFAEVRSGNGRQNNLYQERLAELSE